MIHDEKTTELEVHPQPLTRRKTDKGYIPAAPQTPADLLGKPLTSGQSGMQDQLDHVEGIVNDTSWMLWLVSAISVLILSIWIL